MSKIQLLPSIDIQHDSLAVFDDISQGLVEEENIWVSCYKEGQNSVHGKVRLRKNEGIQGVGMEAIDGIQVERKTHTTFSISASNLKIESTLVRFPRQRLDTPENTDSKAPLGINTLDVSPSGSHVVYGGPDGYCYVQETNPTSTSVKPTKLKGHVGDVLDVRWFPSGEVVLTASSDATIRIFSSSTGVNPRTLIGHKRAVTSTAILGVGRNVLSGSKDGSIKLWDVSAGKCVSTMYNKGFVGVEKICQGKSAEKIRELAKRVETGDNDGEDYAPRTLEGEIPTDTADKIVFAGLSSGSGLLSAFDLASKKPIFPSFSHIPTSTSVTTNRQGGAIYALAYQPDAHLLASGSAKGIVVVRDTRMISNEKNQALQVFSRSEASINDLTFLKTQRGPELVVAPASGMPYRASLPMSDSDGDVRIVEEFAGWEAVAINSIAVGNGEGNIWVGGSDAGLRRY